MRRSSRYGEALGIASRIVSRLDTGSYNSVPDKDVKALADAVILMHSALSESTDTVAVPREVVEFFVRWNSPGQMPSRPVLADMMPRLKAALGERQGG